MYSVKLRFAPYESGTTFKFTLMAAAETFAHDALKHGQPDKDGLPLVAEIWEEHDTNHDTRKPDDEEE